MKYLLLIIGIALCSLVRINDCDSQRCLKSDRHLKFPTEQPFLFEACTPWVKKACCNFDTTQELNQRNADSMQSFLCGARPKAVSSLDCLKFMLKISCLYECSPNLGPWIVKIKGIDEIKNVPLCQEECDLIYKHCSNDLICTNQWSLSKQPICSYDTDCKKVKQVFNNSTVFCAKFWNDAFRVVDDDEPCISLIFNEQDDLNPNDEVANYYQHTEYAKRSSASSLAPSIFILLSKIFKSVVSKGFSDFFFKI